MRWPSSCCCYIIILPIPKWYVDINYQLTDYSKCQNLINAKFLLHIRHLYYVFFICRFSWNYIITSITVTTPNRYGMLQCALCPYVVLWVLILCSWRINGNSLQIEEYSTGFEWIIHKVFVIRKNWILISYQTAAYKYFTVPYMYTVLNIIESSWNTHWRDSTIFLLHIRYLYYVLIASYVHTIGSSFWHEIGGMSWAGKSVVAKLAYFGQYYFLLFHQHMI